MNEGMRRRAQDLRRNATPQEKKLWYQYLRTYPIQWNRQKQLGSYIVDFYCRRAKLVVELDGSQHYTDEAQQYDRIRTEYMNAVGITVLRYANSEIDNHFPAVCESIHVAVQKHLPPGEGGTAQP